MAIKKKIFTFFAYNCYRRIALDWLLSLIRDQITSYVKKRQCHQCRIVSAATEYQTDHCLSGGRQWSVWGTLDEDVNMPCKPEFSLPKDFNSYEQ